MTDDPTPDDLAPEDPASAASTEDAVRRLLAEARHDEPIPPAVAERLDRALTGLVAQRSTPAVTSLSSRRRRVLTTGLVAAAAVVVVGVAGPMLTQGGGSDTSADESAAVQDTGEREFRGTDDGEQADAPTEESAGSDEESAPAAGERLAAVAAGPGRLARQATRLREEAMAAYAVTDDAALATGCAVATQPGTEAGREDVVALFPVSVDGQEALLVYDAPTVDGQQVRLFLCPAGELVREVRIAP